MEIPLPQSTPTISHFEILWLISTLIISFAGTGLYFVVINWYQQRKEERYRRLRARITMED